MSQNIKYSLTDSQIDQIHEILENDADYDKARDQSAATKFHDQSMETFLRQKYWDRKKKEMENSRSKQGVDWNSPGNIFIHKYAYTQWTI